MKILILPRYDRLGASSRLRLYQYVPYFENSGFQCTVKPLFGDDYVKSLYEGSIGFFYVILAYWKRMCVLLSANQYDIVLLEKELFPWIPAWLELLMLPDSAVLVADYDDAVFHRYDEHKSLFVRKVLGRKIDGVMKHASLVIAGNAYLAKRAMSSGCSRVEIIPTVIDLTRYPEVGMGRSSNKQSTIGWIGSPSTAAYLEIASNAAKDVQAQNSVRFLAVGARADQVLGTPFNAVKWTEDSEVDLIMGFDIGIMPLVDEPWERGKCGYKLIQYMACSIPVIASPVGVNKSIVQPTVNGYLCDSESDWYKAMTDMIIDPETRNRMGKAGRALVEKEYCVQVQAPRMISYFNELIASRRAI